MQDAFVSLKWITAVACVAFAVGCAKKKPHSRALAVPPAPAPQETPQPSEHKVSAPAPQTSDPVKAPSVFPKKITVTLNEKSLSLDEPISVVFESYGYILWDHVYVFKKSFLGPTDERATFFWQTGDDVTWNTPWKVISFDHKTAKVYGGTKAGEGDVIGEFKADGDKYSIELSVPFVANKKDQRLDFSEVKPAVPQSSNCPMAVKALGVCELYAGIYSVLAGIDYSAFGEVAPGVIADVASFETMLKLTKSVLFFKPRVDTIRSDYLIPLIKSIAQLKALRTADQKNRATYLQLSRQTYANLVVTAVDSVLKTQKMMPEALGSMAGTALGSVLAYLDMNAAADYAIALGNPPWFRELVSPVIREVGRLSVDLILNGSGTPMQTRIDRFLAMEEKLKDTVRRICAASPTSNQNECTEAWSH